MADNITYRFIQNVGDYFPSGYFTEDFADKVQKCAGCTADEMKELNKPFIALRAQYEEYKNFIINAHPRVKDAIRRTHEWHSALLRVLGYDPDHAYQEPFVVSDKGEFAEIIPVRHILRSGDKISMLIMEMQHLISVNEQSPAGLFEQQYESEPDRNTRQQRYYAGQWADVIPARYLDKEKYHFSPAVINKAITQLFLMPEERRPRFILMLAGNVVFLFNKDKWARGAYLQFSLDDLYAQGQLKSSRNHYALFQLLVNKEALAADGQTVLMDSLIEESYKNAYEVTKDLKEGVILAVETLANEALYYMKYVAHRPFGKKHAEEDGTVTYDENDDDFETEVKDDCLTIIYRLLFILFAESRPELEILPTGDEVYKRGYSFEALRDLEQVRLISDEARNGYFFDDSIHHLFAILSKGFHKDDEADNKSFRVRPIDSPMFNDRRLKQLQGVRIRNVKWQEIIRALSLSRSKKYCGRISYANLGVNQLGSVYESLLAYRGFYAEEDYIEVCKAGAPEDGTYLVPYSRMEVFDIKEVVCDEETGEPRRLPKGTFVYRLNGRDRQKSASYYTPEVLTRSTIKYTIKAIVDEVREGMRKPMELLDLKILEPAVGAAAFLNEVINQLAEAYMTYVEKKPAPDRYRDELQKVKAYIATHNVYGVDLNPTAIELGKLSLWLNVIHKDMETPFFANRLTVGNAVIGAWLKVYARHEVLAKKGSRKLEANEWWTKAPHKVRFGRTRVNRSVNEVYHFLLPDKAMLAALGLRDMKRTHAAEAKLMADRLKDWTAPVGEEQFGTLQRLSAKIDLLLREAMETQVNIERLTNNRRDIWPHETFQGNRIFRAYEQAENYVEKERIFDTRYRRDNAYYKLKLVMDYWCALWFWEYQDAFALPTREEYWREIENLLDVSNDKLDRNTQRAMSGGNTVSEEPECEYGGGRMTEEQAQIVAKSKEEILESTTSRTTLFAEEEPERFKIVKRLAGRYHFFHPMLEFIEVFWLRDGFDVICGNPPWIKWQYEPLNIISDKYPEYAIRGDKDADAVERLIKTNNYFNDPLLKMTCEDENIECVCTSNMQNSPVLYSPLKGSQSDLFKSILYNSLEMINPKGYVGMVHPPTPFIEAKGQLLREYLYTRLRYVFQYENYLLLFSEVHPEKPFNVCIYSHQQDAIEFTSMSDVFHPNMIDASINHQGDSVCQGRYIVDNEGKKQLSLEGHKDRIVHYNQTMLRMIARVFENSDEWQSCKLVSIHSQKDIELINKLSQCGHLSSVNPFITVCFDATNAKKDNTIKEETKFPDYDKYEMIFNSTMVNLSSPFAKLPQSICKKDSQYDTVDYTLFKVDDIIRTNYLPKTDIINFKNKVDATGTWFTRYKLALKKMLDSTHERTLKGGIIPPKASHTNSIISASFNNVEDLLIFTGLSSSVILDYFLKTIRCKNLTSSVLSEMPFEISNDLKGSLIVRVLRLNCVNIWYADLWTQAFNANMSNESWSTTDKRLSPYSILTTEYSAESLLRNDFERRQALLEIDVITALSLKLTFEDLVYIYKSTFGTTQKYEADTWYDANGRIIFSVNGDSNLKLPRKGNTKQGVQGWEDIRGESITDEHGNIIGYQGTTPTYTHTIDPTKSELYAGQTITYEAPFTCCDRIQDYRTAWKYFEERFNQK